MSWDFKDGIPIYSQIIEKIKARIVSEVYAPGSKLPSVRELAVDVGVNPNTMQKALAELERSGLVYSMRTSGRFITEDKEVLANMKTELCNEFINDLFSSLNKLGMTNTEIAAAVNEFADATESD